MLIDEQNGFWAGHSTAKCNISFYNYVFNAFADGLQVKLIYTDFSKALDSVKHLGLVVILCSSGFGEPLLSWFLSYLSYRPQRVKIYGLKSDPFTIISDMPQQGGHLSPILFSIFINSAKFTLKHCRLLCFTDDTKLFMKIDFLNDCKALQNDLDEFAKWGKSFG